MKETVGIDILVISRNGDRKIMQSIRVTSEPLARIQEYKWTSRYKAIKLYIFIYIYSHAGLTKC